ncbi:SIS domain-containing protein [Streptomyces sp. TRM66268-LWL]|uniref:SIS domain-containing protein n=1 Tax=Streptomyces polyasparticus TaxID=2767826 RepID=A0ABR7SHY6_9ACTN|nr:SIS domain-containing protein [Streptomyces polyasparticus]MBC9713923.1 SIS domain-containing protein [Streptomyces polyasparticus]
MSDGPGAGEVPDTIRELYPFLYEGSTEPDAVPAEVMHAVRDKAAELIALRRTVVAACAGQIAACAGAMAERFAAGGRLFTFGNGGSSTDAQGLATTFLHPPPGSSVLPALSLTSDAAVVTALSNDVGFEWVFARQLAAVGRRADIAVGLTTSGGSANVLRAFEEAARQGLLTVALAGRDGGRLAGLDVLDHLFVVPSDSVHRIQEAQATVCHTLWEVTQQALGGARDMVRGEAR